jgi:hypothetical protein
MINKGFLNTNTAISWQVMQTARMQEVEWRQVLRGSVGMGTKEAYYHSPIIPPFHAAKSHIKSKTELQIYATL